MNVLLWVLQIVAALLYGASGVMKVFMFDKIRRGRPVLCGAVASASLDGPWHHRTGLRGGVDPAGRLPLASDTHRGGRRGPGRYRKPRVRWGAQSSTTRSGPSSWSAC